MTGDGDWDQNGNSADGEKGTGSRDQAELTCTYGEHLGRRQGLWPKHLR